MISEVIQTQVNIALMEKFRSSMELKWSKLEKGLTNLKYVISTREDKPLAICKFFTDDGIIAPKIRFEREKQALEVFGGSVAPKLIWSSTPNVILYEYIIGKELNKFKSTKDFSSIVSETIKDIHREAKIKKKPLMSNVTKFYQDLITEYKKSDLSYPNKMIKELQEIVNSQKSILEENQDRLTYIHGDLVPPNLLFKNDKVFLIDWEFFRPELDFFDIAYFNYYAKEHNIPIELEIKNDEIKQTYQNLVDILEKLWHFGYQNSNPESI